MVFHGFNAIDHYQSYHLDVNPARSHPASFTPAESSTSFQGRFLRSPSLQSDGTDGQSQAEIGGPPTQVRVDSRPPLMLGGLGLHYEGQDDIVRRTSSAGPSSRRRPASSTPPPSLSVASVPAASEEAGSEERARHSQASTSVGLPVPSVLRRSLSVSYGPFIPGAFVLGRAAYHTSPQSPAAPSSSSDEEWDWDDTCAPPISEHNTATVDNEYADSSISVPIPTLEERSRCSSVSPRLTSDEPQFQSTHDDVNDPGLDADISWLGNLVPQELEGLVCSMEILEAPVTPQALQSSDESQHTSYRDSRQSLSAIPCPSPVQPCSAKDLGPVAPASAAGSMSSLENAYKQCIAPLDATQLSAVSEHPGHEASRGQPWDTMAPFPKFASWADDCTDDQSGEETDCAYMKPSADLSPSRAPSSLLRTRRSASPRESLKSTRPRVDPRLATEVFAKKQIRKPDSTGRVLEWNSSVELIKTVPPGPTATPQPSMALPIRQRASFQPYVNLAHAVGLPHMLKKEPGDGWAPVWTVFPLKVFRGSAYRFVKIQAEWDDEALLGELSKTYDELRTVWRKWFSLRSVA